MTQAYPLKWPAGRPRKDSRLRKRAAFGKAGRGGWKEELSVADGLGRLQRELNMIGARHVVLSSNVELRLDGFPRSGQREPDDPGVCLYFDLSGKPTAMPCDTYDRVADNIAAIAAHIEATRKIERYGVSSVSEMFAGFQALPAPGHASARQWWQVLGVPVDASLDQIKTAYRARAKECHSDHGGSDSLMAELNAARDAALMERG